MQFPFRFLARGAAVLLAGAAFAMGAAAQEAWPSRPLKFVAPIAPGGLTDSLTRVLAAGLTRRLGQQVVVENRAGGGGIIGTAAAAKLPADGYHLLMVYQGVASVNPVLHTNLPYDTLRDFAPIAQVATFPMVLAVRNDLPAKTLADFLALARSKPGGLSYASAGNATTSHLTMELFKRRTDLKIVHVPYKGEGPALTDLMGGQVDATFITLATVMPQLKTGRVRVLGITSRERSTLAPTLPTLAEGGLAGFQAVGWYGVLAPAGTPRPIVERLNKELLAVLAEPETQATLAAQAVDPAGSSPEALRQWIVEDTARWRQVINDAGIKAD